MTKKHIANKSSDAISLRKGRKDYEELIKKYGIEGETFSDQMQALVKHLLSHNSVETVEIEEKFDCNKLCQRARECRSQAMFDLGEIRARDCYVPNYPKYCHFLIWEGNPYGDPDKPHPKCLNPKPPLAIPRDHIIQDPQICWKCMKIKKRLKEEKLLKKAMSDEFKGQPRVNWYPSSRSW